MDTGVEPDDEFIAEASLARVEEVVEPLDELLEDLVDQLCLHLGWQLLIQGVLLHDQVKVEMESLGDCSLDRLSKARVEVVWRVGFLNALHPQVELGDARVEQVCESDLGVEEGAHL